VFVISILIDTAAIETSAILTLKVRKSRDWVVNVLAMAISS
jgi:hypothetical protein